MSKPHFLEPVLRPAPGAKLVNQRSGKVVASVLETALDSQSRNRGLLGRDGLPAGHALIIAPTGLIHTFSMRFNIDVAFVARDGRVVKVCSDVPPRRIAGALCSFAVVELAAGMLKLSETQRGDLLQIVC